MKEKEVDINHLNIVPLKFVIFLTLETVSGLHARIQKTEESLLITDLDSTNGTFIDEKRLRPGVAASALPGCKITFGKDIVAFFLVIFLRYDLP